MKSFENMFFLSGLGRTGSSLLTAILSENPEILAKGTSPMLALIHEAFYNLTKKPEGVTVYNTEISPETEEIINQLLSQIPNICYSGTEKKYIIDKNRSWTHPEMIEMIEKYITKKPKFIIMLRPIVEIFESLYYIAEKNNRIDWFYDNIFSGEILIKPLENIRLILDEIQTQKNKYKDYFLFINYQDLVLNTKETIEKIYNFLEIPYFDHNFKKIHNLFPEHDYGIKGLHEIRTTISKREKNVILPDRVLLYASYLQKDLEISFREAGINHVF